MLAAIFVFLPALGSRERSPKTPQINAQQKSEAGLKSQSQPDDQKGGSAPSASATPLDAPSVATPKSQRDTHHGDDEGTEFWPPFFGLRLKITDSLLALFTFGLFIATWFLYGSTRDLVEGADRAAQAELRAYVHYNGCHWTSHPEKAMTPVFWRLRPYWINSGNTPTRRLWVYTHCELLDNPLGADYQFIPDHNIRRPVMIAPHGEIESEPHDFSGDDLVAINQRRKHLYVWGIARYRDVFPNTIEHVTKFCVVANISGHQLEPWHITANPFDIYFAPYDRHNCADEDCEGHS